MPSNSFVADQVQPVLHPREATSFNTLEKTELQALSNSTCQDDLVRLRTRVVYACTASEDVMTPGGIAYPGKLGHRVLCSCSNCRVYLP